MKRWLKIKFPKSLSLFSNSYICLGLIRKEQLVFTMFWKSRPLEFLLLKPYREQLTHLKNAHFINMKKRDLFEWYKDGCTKTCKNFLAWLFFLLYGVLQFLPFSMNIHIGKFIDMKMTSLTLQAGFISNIFHSLITECPAMFCEKLLVPYNFIRQ